MCVPLFAVVFGTYKKLSKPSKTLRKQCSFPLSSKAGLILSRYFFNMIITIINAYVSAVFLTQHVQSPAYYRLKFKF